MTDEPTIVTEDTVLPKEAAAVVTIEGATNLSLLLPGLPDDENLPPLMVYLAAVFMRARDPVFYAEQLDWFEAQGVMMELQEAPHDGSP